MITIRRLVPYLKLYCGNDGLIVPAMSIGAYGVISIISNYNPRIIIDIINMCTINNYSKAFELYTYIDEMIKLLFSESNPSPIKYILKIKGLISFDMVRLPLVEMQNDINKEKLIIIDNKLQAHYCVANSKISTQINTHVNTQINSEINTLVYPHFQEHPWGC
jgi:dihydrodipicolinate synthase/N-acetylneuraminate lyase